MEVVDFRIKDNDIVIGNGDIELSSPLTAEADLQHIEDLLLYSKGSLKEFPAIGVGAIQYVGADNSEIPKINTLIQRNLKADLYTVISIGQQKEGLLSLNLDTAIINVNAVRDGI